MQSIEVCSRHSHVNVIHSDILVLDKDFSRLNARDRKIFEFENLYTPDCLKQNAFHSAGNSMGRIPSHSVHNIAMAFRCRTGYDPTAWGQMVRGEELGKGCR